jgi:hypothetical protein
MPTGRQVLSCCKMVKGVLVSRFKVVISSIAGV